MPEKAESDSGSSLAAAKDPELISLSWIPAYAGMTEKDTIQN